MYKKKAHKNLKGKKVEKSAGQAAVITGATSGIGRATAELFVEHGLKVLISGRNKPKLEKISKELGCPFVLGDLAERQVADRLLPHALDTFGRCDILINNAGIVEVGPVDNINIDRVCDMVRINVESAFRLALIFARYFKQQNSGHLVNISSILGTKTRENAGAYAGTKYAIEALSESLRMEMARTRVKVTCIEPGLVKTELHRHWEKHPVEAFGIPNPLMPIDIAETILYILNQKQNVRFPKVLILPDDHVI